MRLIMSEPEARGPNEHERPSAEVVGIKPVSPAIAVRRGKLFGDGTGAWTRMQAAYNTWQAERQGVKA